MILNTLCPKNLKEDASACWNSNEPFLGMLQSDFEELTPEQQDGFFSALLLKPMCHQPQIMARAWQRVLRFPVEARLGMRHSIPCCFVHLDRGQCPSPSHQVVNILTKVFLPLGLDLIVLDRFQEALLGVTKLDKIQLI